MPHDTEPDKESYQAQMSSSDRFRLRRLDNVVKENFDFFVGKRKTFKLQGNSTRQMRLNGGNWGTCARKMQQLLNQTNDVHNAFFGDCLTRSAMKNH
jgi:hypothetical protein